MNHSIGPYYTESEQIIKNDANVIRRLRYPAMVILADSEYPIVLRLGDKEHINVYYRRLIAARREYIGRAHVLEFDCGRTPIDAICTIFNAVYNCVSEKLLQLMLSNDEAGVYEEIATLQRAGY